MKKEINELDLAKSIFENGLEKITQKNLNLLSKYLRETLKYGDRRIEKTIIDYCEKCEENFNIIMSFQKIEKAIRYSHKNREILKNFSPIPIYRTWIEDIKKIKDFKTQVIFLSMIVYANRFYDDRKYLYFYISDISNILEISGIKMTVGMFMKKYYFLLKSNNLTEHKAGNEYIKLKIEKIENNREEPQLFVDDFKNIKSYHADIFGDGVFFCKTCKKQGLRKNGNQIYCKECLSEKTKEKDRLRQR